MIRNLHPRLRIYAILFALLFCISNTISAQHNALLGYGNGYVNISKKTNGGAVQTGDTLEIRTTYYFGPGYNGNKLYNVRYYDSVPLKTTMLVGTFDSLKLITNEGITVSKFTRVGTDDPGTYTAAPGTGKYQIRMNVGTGAASPGSNPGVLTDDTGAGVITIGTFLPKIFSGVLLTTSYRVKVTGLAGETIVLAVGKLVYQKSSSSSADTTINSIPYKILIDATASALCTNGLGNNRALEYNGTFGSGNTQNRATALAFPIPQYTFTLVSRTGNTGDGSYAVVNNSSPRGKLNTYAKMQPLCTPYTVTDSCDDRMFGYWDIIGDHTGKTDTASNLPVAPGTNGGYMLMVNADVVTSEAYKQNVTGLCSDTYYEFSAWIKNICKRCGYDKSGTQTNSIGVKPNIVFSINGVDIYSSGDLDSLGWKKKGFVFKTGPSQTGAIISIRNNAPGGGGNDWAMDDLAIGTCGPASSMNYKPFALGCADGATFTLQDTIRYSYNPNYSYYKWQRSTDGGLTWSAPPQPIPNNDSVAMGPPVNGKYEFVTNFGPILVTGADSGHLYRVLVGTNATNLSSPDCSFNDGTSVMMKIITCPPTLDANTVAFSGKLKNDDKATLTWLVADEKNFTKYQLEKSSDGISFTKINEQAAKKTVGMAEFAYNDEDPIKGNTYYRLKVYTANGLYKYSKTVVINHNYDFQVNSLLNPFSYFISSDIIIPADGVVKMVLYDAYGKVVGRENKALAKGLNKVQYTGWYNLSRGMYFISFGYNNASIQRKLVKIN